MKLSKMELDAVANKLQNELQELASIAQKDLSERADTDNLKEAKIILRQIRSFKPALKTYLDCSRANSPTLESILYSMRPKQTKVKLNRSYDTSAIRNALIIAQIDSPDLESMITVVKKQFIS